jgi:pSer/pThr/pTyr-binding forkhead associated (FHA) protein
MSSLLVSLDGHADIPLDRGLIVVGRYHRCDVRIHSQRVSRHHCCLSREEGAVLVRDLDSTNGTFLNGRRIRNGRLRPGDELQIAHHRYRLVDDPDRVALRAVTGRPPGQVDAGDTSLLTTLDPPQPPNPPGRDPGAGAR